MRSSSYIRRVVALLLGCWLMLFVSEPTAMHVCAMHDLAGHGSSSAAPAHGMHRHSHAAHPCCTCPGCCQPGSGLLPPRPTVVAASVVVSTDAALPSIAATPVGDPQLLLPPALGPPATVI